MGRERVLLAKEAAEAKRRAQAEKNEGKTRMKGKNRPSRKYRKKQTNIIEEKKVGGLLSQLILCCPGKNA